MLSLVTGRLFNSDERAISEDLFSLDQLSITGQRSQGLRPSRQLFAWLERWHY